MDCDIEIQDALEIYGSFLIGQTNGMNDALSLPAVAAALELTGTPLPERPEVARRLLLVHADCLAVMKIERGRAGG